jgi:hypothetical protein
MCRVRERRTLQIRGVPVLHFQPLQYEHGRTLRIFCAGSELFFSASSLTFYAGLACLTNCVAE